MHRLATKPVALGTFTTSAASRADLPYLTRQIAVVDRSDYRETARGLTQLDRSGTNGQRGLTRGIVRPDGTRPSA